MKEATDDLFLQMYPTFWYLLLFQIISCSLSKKKTMEATPMEEDMKQLLSTSHPPQSQSQSQSHGEISKRRKLSEFIARVQRESISSGEYKTRSDRSTITSEHSPHDSDNDRCARSPSPPPPLCPPNKLPCQLRLLSDFKTPDELKMLKSVAGEVVELKDYAEWFNSLGAEVNKDEILWPKYYCQWLSTLGKGAKVDGILDPSQYIEWYVSKFVKPKELVDWPSLIERYAKLALAHLKEINEGDDYEYVRDVAIMDCPRSFHLNFYASSRVSESTSEAGLEKLFFAEVDTQNKVAQCCVLEYEEFGGFEVQHPPNVDCIFCSDICYSHSCE